jgi:hypothetical protein
MPTLPRVLNALADLAPVSTQVSKNHIGDRLAWGFEPWRFKHAHNLMAYDELHSHERLLRLGWGVIFGSETVDGKRQRVRLPLASLPVRLTGRGFGYDQRAEPAGDITVLDDLAQTDFAPRLIAKLSQDASKEDDSLEWLQEAAAVLGYDDLPVFEDPRKRTDHQTLMIHPTWIVYVDKQLDPTPIADSLRYWASVPGVGQTALGAIYSADDHDRQPPAPGTRPFTVLPLNRAQEECVAQARHAPVTVVTGAPGCGKSHALAAIALDTIAHGQSVLIATQSVHAADVLGDLLTRHPGPTPVRFGDSERRDALLTDLTSGTRGEHGTQRIKQLHARTGDALALLQRVEAEIATALTHEEHRRLAEDAPMFLLDDFPGLADADLDAVTRLLDGVESTPDGIAAKLRARRDRRRLRALVGADPASPLLRKAIELARYRQSQKLLSTGGTRMEPLWRHLDAAEQEARAATGALLEADSSSTGRSNGRARKALRSLATALRQGSRVMRRDMLRRIDDEALLLAKPLWIGTVTDVEDLLPVKPGMFDLVILDEASHINQHRAAPVLARGRRAVVAGDPRQLRFVAFSTGPDAATLRKHGLNGWEDRLDTGKISAYDLAAGAGPAVVLDEHHRSVPQLIGFSAAKFYNGRVKPVTAHPRLHGTDRITVHHVDATSSVKGTVQAEVDQVMALLTELVGRGERDLAVLCPFRAQIEAIESAIIKAFDVEQLREHRIRSGTVHSFQGGEADTVIAAFGIGPGDAAGRKRFIANPNLFNVMVSRSRRTLHVVTALREADGILGEFLTYAERSHRAPASDASGEGWTGKIAAALLHADVEVHCDYPVGGWTVDLVAGSGDGAVGVVCRPHPDGARAHVARQRTLLRAGWRLVDVFPSAYGDDAARAALDVMSMLERS